MITYSCMLYVEKKFVVAIKTFVGHKKLVFKKAK